MQKRILNILFQSLILFTGDYLYSSLPGSVVGDTLLGKKIEIVANERLPKQLGNVHEELSKYVEVQIGIQRRDKPLVVDRIYSTMEGQFIHISMVIPVEAYDSRMDRLINLGARFRHHVDLKNRFDIYATFSISTLAGEGYASKSKLKFYFGQGSMAKEMLWTIDFETLLKNEVRKSLENLIPQIEPIVSKHPFVENIIVGIPGGEFERIPEGISEFNLGQVPLSILPEELDTIGNFSISGTWYFEADIRPYNGKYGTSRAKFYLDLIEEDHSIRVKGDLMKQRGFLNKEYFKKDMKRLLLRELHKYEIGKVGWRLMQGKEDSPYYLQLYADNFKKNEFYEIHPLGKNKMMIRTWIHKSILGKPGWPIPDGSLQYVDIVAVKKKVGIIE